MATTQFNNRLITPELTEALSSYPHGGTAGRQ